MAFRIHDIAYEGVTPTLIRKSIETGAINAYSDDLMEVKIRKGRSVNFEIS